MTPKVFIPEVTNVNQDDAKDFIKVYLDSEEECVYI